MSSGSAIRAAGGPPVLLTRRESLLRATEHAVFGFGPVVASLALLAFQFKIHAVAVDFHSAYYPAAVRFLAGASPYAATHHAITGGTAFVYPALSVLGFAPFALLSRGIAQIVYMLICIACVPATLHTLRVRDWRVYGVVFYWLPIYGGWQSSNLTLPLLLLAALLWRHRDRPVVAGLLVALAVSLKPFVWPLGLWLLATRRLRAAAWSLAGGVALNLLAWLVVGPAQLSVYLHLSSQVTDALWRGGYSMLAVAHHLGLGRGSGELMLFCVAALSAGAVVFVGLAHRDDRAALALTVLLMLVASPLVWSHYFALLLLPIALYRPRLGWLWAVPVLMWPMPPSYAVTGWEAALAWTLTAGCLLALLRERRSPPASRGVVGLG